MPLPIPVDADLSAAVTGRAESIFQRALQQVEPQIDALITGSTLLIAGAAGSIGSATTEVIAEYRPHKLVLADTDENGLAELIRSLRSRGRIHSETIVQPVLIDITSPWIRRLSTTHGPFDGVLNFAASKHVRSERDTLSLLRMYDVNVRGTTNLTELVDSSRPDARFFSVSSDKAANPTSLMGASKRLMELEMARTRPTRIASCRFANVAFSSGSLLESWLRRIPLGQPVAVPRDIKRYFITPEEAGQLCLITYANADGTIYVPALSADRDLRLLTDVLDRVLAYVGRTPIQFDDEAEAVRRAASLAADGQQAVLVTNPDTSGEKLYEEFAASDEQALPTGLPEILQIPLAAPSYSASAALALIQTAREGEDTPTSLDEMIGAVEQDVPTYVRSQNGGTLDDRL